MICYEEKMLMVAILEKRWDKLTDPHPSKEKRLIPIKLGDGKNHVNKRPPVRVVISALYREGLIHYKRAWYYLTKWSEKKLYDYGVNLELGWLTEEGEKKAEEYYKEIFKLKDNKTINRCPLERPEGIVCGQNNCLRNDVCIYYKGNQLKKGGRNYFIIICGNCGETNRLT